MSVRLMLARVDRPGGVHSPAHDRAILAECRQLVRDILDDAEMRLWELEDAGWITPDDSDADLATSYAARLLLLVTDRFDDLKHAVRLAQEITFSEELK